MKKEVDLFFSTISALHKSRALDSLILIGSWCHHFYKDLFNGSPEIPILRTTDIDLLVPNPPKIKQDVNIPKILSSLDFIIDRNSMTGCMKFVHPDLEIEFLTPERGSGKGSQPYDINKLHINAQGLRYLNLLQSYTTKIRSKGIEVRLPEPAAYVLHKFIIFERRKTEEKRERDLQAAKQIGEFLLKNPEQRTRLKEIFSELPKKWQKRILINLQKYSTGLHEFFTDKNN